MTSNFSALYGAVHHKNTRIMKEEKIPVKLSKTL